MSTQENSNNIETTRLNSNINDTNTLTNTELSKEQSQLLTNEQKIKQLKKNLKILLQKALGKNLLNLETNNQIQLQILTLTTKSYKEFNTKINLMKNQVEENIKKKEEIKKLKKIKVSRAKFRSRTSQKNSLGKFDLNIQSKIKESDKILNNESNKSLTTIRSKTTGKNENRILNSAKKTTKNKNISQKVENNTIDIYKSAKLSKSNSNKFNLTEQSNKKTKKKINLENNATNNKISNTNIKERNNSKEIKTMVKKNNSRTKINVIHKSQYDLKSNSNLLTESKEKTEKDKDSNKKLLTNKRNTNLDYRKSFDYSNKKIPKAKTNNYVKKNTEIFSDKKPSSKKNLLNIKKPKINNNAKDENTKEEDTETIIKRFEKQKKILEKIRKQREETNIREEEKKKEKEKEEEEEKKKAEERKKRDLEIKRREEERKKELDEEERKRNEERKKKQMEIEAKIEQEKMEKEKLKKELEIQKELERKKKLEEERKKREEMEKLELEMDKMKEEEIKELPNNIELHLEKNENDINDNNNKEMNIQDLLELEEKNDQNFEYFHIKEIEKDSLLVTPKGKKDNEVLENKDITENKDKNEDKLELNNIPVILYRNISILELIHDVPKFSPILFEYLPLRDLLEFTSISKKIKRQRIYIFNLQKTKILNYIGFEDEHSLNKKIKEYEENYSSNELNEPYIEFHLSRGAARAIQLLNNNTYSKIFRRPVLDNNFSPIYIAYKILFIFLNEIEIAKISDDKIFWIKCTEYLNSKSENGKIGDFILNKFEKYNCDCKTVYYVEKIMKGKKDNISPSYFSKICGSTGLLIFLIKELIEYCGVIVSTKKTQLSRIYQNMIFFKKIIAQLSTYNKTLENFNQ